MSFKEVELKDFNINPFIGFGEDWALISAGVEKNFNTMTIAWGHMGTLFVEDDGNKRSPISSVVAYVRPQRYTNQFIEREKIFTVSFFDKSYHKELSYLGTHSGKDEDKVAKVKIMPIFNEGTVYFKEAKAILICKKIYQSVLKEEEFIDKNIIMHNYPKKDFHNVYIGKIIKAYIKA